MWSDVEDGPTAGLHVHVRAVHGPVPVGAPVSSRAALALPSCWFAGASSCDGPLQRAHLIPKQRIKREASRAFDVVWDPRVWAPMCERHHRRFDAGLERIDRGRLPVTVEEYAVEHRLGWSLDRDYGPRSAAA